MASYDKTKDSDYTLKVQSALQTLGANLGSAGVDGKWGKYTEAAYQKNKDKVDQLVGQISGGNGLNFSASLIDVPEAMGYDELFSIGQALYAAQAEAQRQAARKQLESAKAQLEQDRVQSSANVENAATARGFGRSTYVTDALQNVDQTAQGNKTALESSFADALAQIAANQATAAGNYANSMWQTQQNAILEAQKFNAQRQQEADLAQWKQAVSTAGKTSAKSSTSGTAKKKAAGASKSIAEDDVYTGAGVRTTSKIARQKGMYTR